MMKHMTRFLPRALVIIVLALPVLVSAQSNGFVPLAQLSGAKLGQIYSTNDLASFINSIFKFALAVGAIGAVLRLTYAGYIYMGQADMWSHKGEAKKIIGDVTLGLFLLLAIWLILYQINPDILTLNALKNITPVSQTQSSGQSSSGQSGGPVSPAPGTFNYTGPSE